MLEAEPYAIYRENSKTITIYLHDDRQSITVDEAQALIETLKEALIEAKKKENIG